jgi:hypothetical protein
MYNYKSFVGIEANGFSKASYHPFMPPAVAMPEVKPTSNTDAMQAASVSHLMFAIKLFLLKVNKQHGVMFRGEV